MVMFWYLSRSGFNVHESALAIASKLEQTIHKYTFKYIHQFPFDTSTTINSRNFCKDNMKRKIKL